MTTETMTWDEMDEMRNRWADEAERMIEAHGIDSPEAEAAFAQYDAITDAMLDAR